MVSSSGGGPTAYFRLAYALYLMEHHDQIPPRFMRRLRDATDFSPAAYEALVGAAYASAGYEIRSAELPGQRHHPQPEFTARLDDVTYSVEAKRKKDWTAKVDVQSDDFLHELERFVRNELMSASRKRLTNAVYWLELSIPVNLSTDDAQVIQSRVIQTIRDLEATFRMKGEPPGPAYVFVTNHTFLANSKSGASWFAMLEGFHIRIYPEGPVDVVTLLVQHDAHRPATTVLKAFRETAFVPTSFDAVPAEMLGADGKPIKAMKVGEKLQVDLPDGHSVRGIVEDVTAAGDIGHVAIRDDNDGKSHLVTLPLTEDEARAHAVHGDLIFGKPANNAKIEKDDVVGMYEWLLWAYRDASREQLLKLVEGHPQKVGFGAMETKELRHAICREFAGAMVARQKGRRGQKARLA